MNNIEYLDNLLFKSCKPSSEYMALLKSIGTRQNVLPARITRTPYILTELGLPLGNIIISKSVVNKAMGINHQGERQEHNVPMSFMRNIARHIADPMLVMRSSNIAKEKTQNDSFVIYSDFIVNEKPVVIPFVIEPEIQKLGRYRISSVYDRQILYDDKNIVREYAKEGLILYSRDLRTLDEWIKKEVQQPLTSRTGIIPARVSGANLDNQNILTKERLVNSYIDHQKETVLIYGGDVNADGSLIEYRVADSILKQRGYNTINPCKLKPFEDIGNIARNATAIAYFNSKDNGKLSKDITPEQLAERFGVQCKQISYFLPPIIISKRNLEIARKDPVLLMLGL